MIMTNYQQEHCLPKVAEGVLQEMENLSVTKAKMFLMYKIRKMNAYIGLAKKDIHKMTMFCDHEKDRILQTLQMQFAFQKIITA